MSTTSLRGLKAAGISRRELDINNNFKSRLPETPPKKLHFTINGEAYELSTKGMICVKMSAYTYEFYRDDLIYKFYVRTGKCRIIKNN